MVVDQQKYPRKPIGNAIGKGSMNKTCGLGVFFLTASKSGSASETLLFRRSTDPKTTPHISDRQDRDARPSAEELRQLVRELGVVRER